MKKLIFVSAVLVCIFQNTYAQTEKLLKVKSDITSLVVYLEGVEVTRAKSLTLAQGRNKVVFEGLSSKLNTSSIRVSTSNNVSILAISSKINYLTDDKEEEKITKIKDSLKIVNNKITAYNDELSTYTIEKDMLLQNQSIGGQTNGVPVVELQKAADFYRTRILDIYNKISKINVALVDLEKAKTRLDNELLELNADYSFERTEVTVLLNTDKSDTSRVELKYLINDAGWTPTYDIKAEDIDKPIKLIYRAQVYNNTGIDWSNVKIKLSTADPNTSATQPTLSPWYLNYSSPSYYYSNNEYAKKDYKYSNQSQQVQTNNMLSYDFEETLIPGVENRNYEMVEISVLSAEFDIKTKYTIPSDDKPYLVDVVEHDLPATYKHLAIPKLEKAAFLLARVSGWEDLNLVEGYANVYYAGTFVGRSFIYTRNASDTLDISLGRDNKVFVARAKRKDFSSTKFIGTKRKETQAWEIIVKNNRKLPIQLEIQDQVPVSQDSEIETEIIDISKAEQDVLSGKLTWKLTLEPSKVEKFNLIYAIKYPKTKPVYNAKESMRSQKMRMF